MKKIVLTAVLGLLSLPAMAAVTCEPLPSCDALGYIFSSSECNGKSSIKCPFDQTKLFCNKPTKCSASQIYDVFNGTCVDATDYCATRGQFFDTSTNKCVSCASGELFDQTKKSCIEICAYNDYKTAIPDGNICTEVQSNNKRCYTDCIPATECGTGFAETATNRVYDSSGKAIAIIQDGQYYKPFIYAAGGMPYARLKEALDAGLVAPKQASVSAVNSVLNTTQTYWLKEGCQGGTDETSGGHYIANSSGTTAPCQSNSSYVTYVVAMKDCADTCPYKATLSVCDSAKYICEKEDCSGKYTIKGCNTSYFNMTAASSASSSYTCPAGSSVEKCTYSSSRQYRCVPDTYGTTDINFKLIVNANYPWGSCPANKINPYSINVGFYNTSGELVSSANVQITHSGGTSNYNVPFSAPLRTGKYKVYMSGTFGSGGGTAYCSQVTYRYSSSSSSGIFIMSEEIESIPYEGYDITIYNASNPTVTLYTYFGGR